MIWIQYLIGVIIIVFTGSKLTRYGDIIGEKTGMSGLWVGILLLAGATSLPELVTSVSAAIFVGAPNLSFGNIFGSNNFNIFIIALLDIIILRSPVFRKASTNHLFTIALGMCLTCLGLTGIILGKMSFTMYLYIISILIGITYVGGTWLVSVIEKKVAVETVTEEVQYGDVTLIKAIVVFSINAVIIVGACIWLSFLGDQIAEITGWGRTFVGSIFLALATSLPELVVTGSALVQVKDLDMALGNIFGSNLFNIMIIPITDLCYRSRSIFTGVEGNHIVTGIICLIMYCVCIIGMKFPIQRKWKNIFGLDTLFLIALYIAGNYILFRMR